MLNPFSLGLLRAENNGYIQVTCEPGIQVFLDGKFKGVSNVGQGGFIMTGIAAGSHSLKVFKEGFSAQEDTVNVVAGKVLEYKVRPFVPKMKITQRGASESQQVVRKVGSLKIQSLPVGCRISITALGIDSKKQQDEWMVDQVPLGTYRATFSALGKEVEHSFQVGEGRETHLFVNILEGKVDDRTARIPDPITPVALPSTRGKPITIPGLGLELLPVAAGEFMMGSPSNEKDRGKDETLHRVKISKPFWLGTYEVTQDQYQSLMGTNPSYFKGGRRPVEKVSWNDAVSFCNKLDQQERKAGRVPPGYTYSLPTEAQWENACRAGTTGPYAGDSLGDLGWYSTNSGSKTHDVGLKAANPWGFHDMHGNVWEWCADWHGSYPSGSVTDPQGPGSGSGRVHRGGSWLYYARNCRSAYRYRLTPVYRINDLGFRLCLSPAK